MVSDAASTCIRIFLVGEQELFVAGLCSLIQNEPGLTVVGRASNRTEALDAGRVEPNIILFDPPLEGAISLDVLPDLIKAAPGASVLLVTAVAEPEFYQRAVVLGAMGFVCKMDPPSVLLKAIRKTHSGEVWINRTLMGNLLRAKLQRTNPETEKIATLTKRELEVITMLCQGHKNRQIAERLFLAECTVRHHLTSIFDKLGIADRLELLIYANQHGLAHSSFAVRAADVIARSA